MNDATIQNNNPSPPASSGGSATKQATGKQLVATVFILSVAAKLFMFPIYLIQSTGRDAYIAMAVAGGFDLIMLGIILFALVKSGDRDFFTLLTDTFGRTGARIISAVVALFMFFKLNVGVAESLLFYADNVFTDFSVSIMIFVLLIFFISVGMHTLRAFCRLNELLVPLVAVGLIALVTVVAMTGYDFGNILPVMRNGKAFADGLCEHTAWVGDFTPLVLFLGRTDMKKRTAAFVAVGGTAGTAIAVFFSVVLCAAFGNVPILVDTSTNVPSILQFSVGNLYGRTDMFSSILWSVAAFIGNALLFYSTCRCVAFTIGKSAHMIIACAVCVPMYFIQVFAMTDQTLFSAIVTSLAASVAVPILAALIPILAVACSLRRCKNNSSSAQASGDAEVVSDNGENGGSADPLAKRCGTEE
ncbi:MAG: GerAB/ArcD/ProY family transporter [Clostridia bacterium]|nr:GerAB/ArcD/ProY family transporter [Clostridia bacterium]